MKPDIILASTNANTQSCSITCNGNLTGSEATEIRKLINEGIAKGCSTIYLDTKALTNTDLCGINEIIHSAYTIANSNCQFILVYKSGSAIEKWICTTGIDTFVQTAMIPA